MVGMGGWRKGVTHPGAPREGESHRGALGLRPPWGEEGQIDTLQPQETSRQYEEELRAVRGDLLKMGGLVERQIAEAMEALVNRDTVKAREIIARDTEVNRLDVETDERCIRLLALHQPAASDLRFITTELK